MEFAQTDDVVRVTSVEQGSQASEQGVGTGDILLEVAGSQVTGLRKDEVIEAIKKTQRPNSSRNKLPSCLATRLVP